MPFIKSDSNQIYWEESGSGEPVLLIMGLGYAHQMWFRTRAALSMKYRTVLFDNRGVGKSDVPPGPYSMAQMADDAACVLDAAGIDRARVFGISMGGMIAQELTLRHPERVERLVLGCTNCGGKECIPAARPVLDILKGRAGMTPEEGAEAMVPYIYDASTPRERIDQDLVIRRSVYPTPEGYLGQLQAVLAWSSFDRLPQIQTPTLLMHGETDQLVPPQNAAILANRIAGSKVMMLPHASHIFTTDQPEQAHAAIIDFLER